MASSCPDTAPDKDRLVQRCWQPNNIRPLLPDQDTVFSTHILSSFSPVDPSEPAALLPQLIKKDKSPSAQALSAIYFGKMRNQVGVYRKGIQLYVEALDQIRHAIVDPILAQSNETLMSVLCLCLYENVVLSEQTAWLKHYEGVAKLVKLRGPDWPKTDFERDISRLCRFMTVLSAGVRKQHCFLAEPRWKIRQGSSEDDTQTAVDMLYDIIADVPGIFHDVDKLDSADRATSSASYTHARERTRQCLENLYNWPMHLASACNKTKELIKEEDGQDLGGNITRLNQAAAAALTLRHAMILCLASSSDFLDLSLTPSSSPDATNPEFKASVRRTLARDICDLATTALEDEHSTSAAFFFIFPLQNASQHLDPESTEGQRLTRLMNNVIAGKHGFETARLRQWARLFNSPPIRRQIHRAYTCV